MNTLYSKFEEIRSSIYNRLSPTAWIFLGIILCIAILILALQYDRPVADMVAGGAAFFVSLLFAKEFSARCDERNLIKLRNRRSRYPQRTVRIPVAQIANDLVPLVNELPLKKGTLQFVGYDGGYILGKNRNLWKDSLLEWLKKGLNVEYLLVAPSEEVIEAFRRIKEETKKEIGQLSIFKCIEPAEELSESKKDWEQLKTCHPTLFVGDDKTTRAMWIEGNHPIGSEFAYDVTYVPPDAMDDKQNEKFERYKKKIKNIKLEGI